MEDSASAAFKLDNGTLGVITSACARTTAHSLPAMAILGLIVSGSLTAGGCVFLQTSRM